MSNLTATKATAILHENKSRLFGNEDAGQLPIIMVTFDKTFSNDYSFIKSLLLNGMSIARINCAHDDEVVWSAMIHHLKKLARRLVKVVKFIWTLQDPRSELKYYQRKNTIKSH